MRFLFNEETDDRIGTGKGIIGVCVCVCVWVGGCVKSKCVYICVGNYIFCEGCSVDV